MTPKRSRVRRCKGTMAGPGGAGGGRGWQGRARPHLVLVEVGDELVALLVELLDVRVVPVLRLHLAAAEAATSHENYCRVAEP